MNNTTTPKEVQTAREEAALDILSNSDRFDYLLDLYERIFGPGCKLVADENNLKEVFK